MSDDEHCPTCGAATREYSHVLNKNIVGAMVRFAQRYGRELGHLSSIGLTHSQICNFPKLQYWGLVVSEGKSGFWRVTSLGFKFLAGATNMPNRVWTYRNKVLPPTPGREATSLVLIDSLIPGYRHREDYLADSAPHDLDPTQRFL